MGEAIGQILPLATGVALSPIPIIAVILMLVTPRARLPAPRTSSWPSPPERPSPLCWRSVPRDARRPEAMAAHNASIRAVLSLIIGVKRIGDGIAGLSG